MPDYSKGVIYQVISPHHVLPYIGSTTQPLCKRMVGHRAPSNVCRSRIVIEAGDAYIELIEEYPCENREQLNKREGEIIRQRACVNHVVPCRTAREWRHDNNDAVKVYRKTYRKANLEAILAEKRAYHIANKQAENARSIANYYKRKTKAQAQVDVLQEQGQEDIHSEPPSSIESE
jgi:hypothetical protein